MSEKALRSFLPWIARLRGGRTRGLHGAPGTALGFNLMYESEAPFNEG